MYLIYNLVCTRYILPAERGREKNGIIILEVKLEVLLFDNL